VTAFRRRVGPPCSVTGWAILLPAEPGMAFHLLPINDLKPHEASEACWCHPERDDYGSVAHNALDGREAYERGDREPH